MLMVNGEAYFISLKEEEEDTTTEPNHYTYLYKLYIV